jgi:excisionase family DNA binding protein
MVSMEKTQERFVDVKELAAFLAVPCSWIYQHTSDGDIPCMRVGRYVRFWLPDVLAWLAVEGR